MSVFKKVLNKLGLGKKTEEEEEAPEAAAPVAKKPAPKKVDVRKTTRKFTAKKPLERTVTGKKAEAVEMVDVISKLETMAAGSGLNWKQSIVDLLKVLDIDSSYDARKELATELNCPAELMNDSAKMNTWLHKTVLQKIAENGGNIPQDLLD